MTTSQFRHLISGIKNRTPLVKWLDDLRVHQNDLAIFQGRAVNPGGEEQRVVRMPTDVEMTKEWIEIVENRLSEVSES